MEFAHKNPAILHLRSGCRSAWLSAVSCDMFKKVRGGEGRKITDILFFLGGIDGIDIFFLRL